MFVSSPVHLAVDVSIYSFAFSELVADGFPLKMRSMRSHGERARSGKVAGNSAGRFVVSIQYLTQFIFIFGLLSATEFPHLFVLHHRVLNVAAENAFEEDGEKRKHFMKSLTAFIRIANCDNIE